MEQTPISFDICWARSLLCVTHPSVSVDLACWCSMFLRTIHVLCESMSACMRLLYYAFGHENVEWYC